MTHSVSSKHALWRSMERHVTYIDLDASTSACFGREKIKGEWIDGKTIQAASLLQDH